jgi:cysteine synthase A
MNPERELLYSRVRTAIGNTPFVEITGINVPNKCRIFAKAEYRNPTGSHYDREMWRLLRGLEEDNTIQAGKTWMLETTTGNSGSSFAWLCRVLGYPPPMIVIPEDMPYARRAQIESYGAQLKLSAEGQYITGIVNKFRTLLSGMIRAHAQPMPYCPKHWEDENHCVEAMRELGDEILRDADEARVEFAGFMLALGNGASARGVSERLQTRSVELLGMEPQESPVIAEYLELIPQHVGNRTHSIYGTGPFSKSEVYPNMRVAAKYLAKIVHVASEEAARMQVTLADRAFHHVGMSSAACVVALIRHIGESGVYGQDFGTIFYDPAWKYL